MCIEKNGLLYDSGPSCDASDIILPKRWPVGGMKQDMREYL